MSTKIVIKSNAGRYAFEMTDSNQDVLLRSIDFYSLPECNRAIEMVRKNNSHLYENMRSPTGQYYFVVKDRSDTIIATSTMFWSAASRDYAVKMVKRECEDAIVSI